jgi:hypothetical protein
MTKKEGVKFPLYFFVRMWSVDQFIDIKKFEILEDNE